MINTLFKRWREKRRQSHRQKLVEESNLSVVQDFYRAQNFNLDAAWQETDFLAVDLEMTGLNSQNDEIVSIGFLPIQRGLIETENAQHLLIKPLSGVGNSAIIHNIRDQDAMSGLEPAQALEQLLVALTGKVLLVHHNRLDIAFLTRYFKQHLHIEFVTPFTDTFLLEEKQLHMQGKTIGPNDLRLHQCRQRHHLPVYSGHNALTDALATAELFLAIASKRGGNKAPQLIEFIN